MKKNRIIGPVLCLILICSLWIMDYSFISYASKSAETDQFVLDISYGNDNVYRVGRRLDVEVSVKNLGKDFEGELMIQVPSKSSEEYQGEFVNSILHEAPAATYNNKSYGITQSVTLKKDEKKEVTFHLSGMNRVNQLRVSVMQGEQLLQVKDFAVNKIDDEKILMIGSVIEEKENMDYLKVLLSQSDEYMQVYSIYYDGQIPNEIGKIDMLDIIMTTSKEQLSSLNTKAIYQWVLEGGILLRKGEENQNLPIVKKTIGKGMEVQFRDEVCTEDTIYALYESIWGMDGLSSFSNRLSEYHHTNQYWEIYSKLDNIRPNSIPDIKIYMIILGIYIILAGPVGYLILKSMRKQNYLWGYIGTLSILFSVLIFWVSSGTRFRAPFVNYIQTIWLDDEIQSETIEFSVNAPYNKKYDIYVSDQYELISMDEELFWREESFAFSNNDMLITKKADENKISFHENDAFQKSILKAIKTTKNEEQYSISGDITYHAGVLEGTIKNNTPYALHDSYVFFAGKLVKLDEIAPGEELEISTEQLCSIQPGDLYLYIDELYDLYDKETNTLKNLDHVGWESDILKTYILDPQTIYTFEKNQGGVFVGFFEDDKLEFFRDKAYNAYGKKLICSNINISYDKGNKTYDPYFYQKANVLSGNLGIYEQTLYSNESEVRYPLPFEALYDQTDYSLLFEVNDVESLDSIHIEIFNFELGEYEEIELKDGWKITWPYINDNEIQIIYKCEEYGREDGIHIPVIQLQGRK